MDAIPFLDPQQLGAAATTSGRVSEPRASRVGDQTPAFKDRLDQALAGPSRTLLGHVNAEQEGGVGQDPLLPAADALIEQDPHAAGINATGRHGPFSTALPSDPNSDAAASVPGPTDPSVTAQPASTVTGVRPADSRPIDQPTPAQATASSVLADTSVRPGSGHAGPALEPGSPQPPTSALPSADAPDAVLEPVTRTPQRQDQVTSALAAPAREETGSRSTLVRGDALHTGRGEGPTNHSVQPSAFDADPPNDEEGALGDQAREQRRPSTVAGRQDRTFLNDIESAVHSDRGPAEGARATGQASPAPLQAALGSPGSSGSPAQPAVSPSTPVQPVVTAAHATGPEPGGPGGVQSLLIELRPVDLGAVRMRVVLANQTVHAHVTTEHADLGQYLMARQGQLETALNSAGMDMGQFRVLVDRHGHGQAGHDSSFHAAQDRPHEGRRAPDDQPGDSSTRRTPDGEPERSLHLVA